MNNGSKKSPWRRDPFQSPKVVSLHRAKNRQDLERDVEIFKANGGQIQEIPFGAGRGDWWDDGPEAA